MFIVQASLTIIIYNRNMFIIQATYCYFVVIQCHHAGCHYDKCRYTECRGALKRGLPGRSTKASMTEKKRFIMVTSEGLIPSSPPFWQTVKPTLTSLEWPFQRGWWKSNEQSRPEDINLIQPYKEMPKTQFRGKSY